jgi:hypothetical protein
MIGWRVLLATASVQAGCSAATVTDSLRPRPGSVSVFSTDSQ